ncbi:hypothetical protein J6590_105095 [Homalodisca vitripennis]|nr:hypothetical protein J6590_105095 [Homalodisca vitripennis]
MSEVAQDPLSQDINRSRPVIEEKLNVIPTPDGHGCYNERGRVTNWWRAYGKLTQRCFNEMSPELPFCAVFRWEEYEYFKFNMNSLERV